MKIIGMTEPKKTKARASKPKAAAKKPQSGKAAAAARRKGDKNEDA